MRPIVRCLLAHDLAFMPHGEEIAVMDDQPLPAAVERVRADVPPDLEALAVHTDVMDGVLRHLAGILHADGVLDPVALWAEVRRSVRRHGEDHPELAEASTAYDLLRPRFDHSCLDRLQLRTTMPMVDLADQAESLIVVGTLVNPIAGAG